MRSERAAPRLMAISDRRQLVDEGLTEWARRVAAAGVDAIQLREKDLPDRAVYELARFLRARLPTTTAILVNGRADIAVAAGADGVHLPASEVSPAIVARRWGERLLVGRSTHTIEEIEDAASGRADYVTYGPVFPTPSKPGHDGVGLEALSVASSAVEVPILAVGGISREEIPAVAAAGACGAAAIRLFTGPDLPSVVAGAEEAFG